MTSLSRHFHASIVHLILGAAAYSGALLFSQQYLQSAHQLPPLVTPLGFYLFVVAACVGLVTLPRKKKYQNEVASLGVWLGILWLGFLIPLVKWISTQWGIPLWAFPALAAVTGFFQGQIVILVTRSRQMGAPNVPTALFATTGTSLVVTLLSQAAVIPQLGYEKSSLLMACGLFFLLLIAISPLGGSKYPRWGLVLGLPLLTALLWSHSLVKLIEPHRVPLPEGVSIVQKQQVKNNVVLLETRPKEYRSPADLQHSLFIGGKLDFDSLSEQTDHACLINVPLEASRHFGFRPKNALVVSSGHGLVTRNLISVPHIRSVQLIATDPSVLQISSTELKVRMYNLDSLNHEKVKTQIGDPFLFLSTEKTAYDFIVLTLPRHTQVEDPRSTSLEFFHAVKQRLAPKGMLAIRLGSLQMQEESKILGTLREADFEPIVIENAMTQQQYAIATNNKEIDWKEFFLRGPVLEKTRQKQVCRQYHPKERKELGKDNTVNTLVQIPRMSVKTYHAIPALPILLPE